MASQSNSIDVYRGRFLTLLKERAFQKGDFLLSSGKRSNYYIDGKQVVLTAEGAFLAAVLVLEALRDDDFDLVGGPSLGAVPLVGAIAALSWVRGRPINTFFVRKEPKKHGQQRWIEGPVTPGSRVVVVEDVVTTGETVLKALSQLESFGAEVVKVVALVDRLEGAKEKLEKLGYSFEPLFTVQDLDTSN
jgi:orotate phosphoribosyltransferase